jgi:nicotinamide mononucleotide transporter
LAFPNDRVEMGFYQFLHYLQLHYLEILGTITGLIYVIYSIEQKRNLWIYGAISSFFYIAVFFQAGLFAYMTLYFYYVAVSIYGWFAWAEKRNEASGTSGITRLKTRSWFLTGSVVVLLFLILDFILKYTTHTEMAWADALLTSGSVVATWLLVRKVIDHWLLWIGIDTLSGFVSLYKGLPFAAVLFFIYTLLAIKGYFEWKKELAQTLQP